VIVAETDGDLAGYVELAGGSFRRSRATAYLVIGVMAQASGKGVGAGLLPRAKDWAAAHSACSFDGRFIDELYMAALLPGPNPAGPAAGTPGQRAV
jgi:GNAT superfamily N-acetyltransferase